MSKFFNNLKIKQRLMASYSMLLCLMLMLSLISVIGLKNGRNNLESFIQQESAAKESILNIRIALNQGGVAVRDIVMDANPANTASAKQRFDKAIGVVDTNFASLKQNPSVDQSKILDYEEQVNVWRQEATSIIAMEAAGDIVGANNAVLTTCSPALQALGQTATKLTEEISLRADESFSYTVNRVNSAMIFILVIFIIAILLSIVISTAVTNGIVKPVQEVSYAAEQLSKGILNTNIEYEGKDEVGVMAESMRQSMKTLSMYIKDIDVALSTMSKGDFNISATEPFIGDFENIEKSFIKFSEEMSSTLDQINLASDQVANGSDQVSSGAQALAQGATEQAASVEDLSNIINVISEDISQNAKSAQEANELAQKTGQSIIESNEKMKEMTLAMTDISEKSNEISKIIKTIDDIAFQTNILALNAAVEAARAGTAGKGFAVVADEVRNLAQKSAEAAKNTTALIEGTVEAVENGSRIADETAKSLLEIVEDATRTTQMMVDIADASEKQAKAAENIRESISEISAVVQTNSATAEESSAASEELSGQSQVLKDLVSGFTLREGFDSSTNGNAILDFNF